MKLIICLVFCIFGAMDLGKAFGKGKPVQRGEPLGGSCPSKPPMDGIERPKNPPTNPNIPRQIKPSNPKIADSEAGRRGRR